GRHHVPVAPVPAGVTVSRNARAHRVSIAVHATALLLAAAKNVVRHTEAVRAGRFPQDLMGTSVRGKTLGVIGLGGIGGGGARLATGRGRGGGGGKRRGASAAPAEWGGTRADLARPRGASAPG